MRNTVRSLTTPFLATTTLAFSIFFEASPAAAQSAAMSSSQLEIILTIMLAEDERRWDSNLTVLLTNSDSFVRSRAALAAGRIGDESAVTALSEALIKDTDPKVREMVAFALGEIESPACLPALMSILSANGSGQLRGRAIEALGKIAASLPTEHEKQKLEINSAILAALKSEKQGASSSNIPSILLTLTAALRARVPDSGPAIAEFLSHSDARVRADAANALARLRLKSGEAKLRKLLTNDPDGIVRANAARALGAAQDPQAFEGLLGRALNDPDLRVRVSAIRSLGSLNDARAGQPLLSRGGILSKADLRNRPSEANEVLEIAATLGLTLRGSEDPQATAWLKNIRPGFSYAAPELEIAFARISPARYLKDLGSGLPAAKQAQRLLPVHWKAAASLAQGIGELTNSPASLKDRNLILSNAEVLLRSMLDYRIVGLKQKTLIAVNSEYAIPEILRALAAFKPNDLSQLLRNQLSVTDVIVRATAAELLGEIPAEEANERALTTALGPALKDLMNDAALSILDALAKQKTASADETIKTALDSSDHLVRRRAFGLLKINGARGFTSRIGTVKTQNTIADYQRALARSDRVTRAEVATSKGSFLIEFLPEDAPLTVDNFIKLAQKGYFKGQAIPRVVPNFVVQAGDPRGDQNGGPGYTIRCEINQVPYNRANVGMALSGKDTGGSQWFVTHSPQPHLDGGYTVFGRVISGMDVVDSLVRGDIIRRVSITEPRKKGSRK